WQAKNFMPTSRRVWMPPMPRNLGFSPVRDAFQVFTVAGNGIMHATITFNTTHADQLYPRPPFRIAGDSVSCAHYEGNRERTAFTDGTPDNFFCYPLPWPNEQSDVPSSYRPETRAAY